jgi:hypothetical protein
LSEARVLEPVETSGVEGEVRVVACSKVAEARVLAEARDSESWSEAAESFERSVFTVFAVG